MKKIEREVIKPLKLELFVVNTIFEIMSLIMGDFDMQKNGLAIDSLSSYCGKNILLDLDQYNSSFLKRFEHALQIMPSMH